MLLQMAAIMSEQQVVFSVELLIDAIKQYPVLFDKSHPRYKEVEFKKELWMKIAAELGVTAATCQTKFKNLKDSFTKLKTKIKDKTKSGAGAADVPSVKWKHFEAMVPIMEKVYEEPILCTNITFRETRGPECHGGDAGTSQDEADEFLCNDLFEGDEAVDLERCGSSTSELSGSPAATSNSYETPTETDEVEEANPSAPRVQKSRRTSRNRKTTSEPRPTSMDVAAECLSHLKTSRESREQQKDVLYHFGLTIVGMLRMLPSDDQFDTMNEVQNLVYQKVKEVRQREKLE
ncbi:hypothetical protein MTO96_008145 [Rhipicephalus appendiculatus]